MGSVYEGTNAARQVRAIKLTAFICGPDDDQRRTRFLHEAQMLAKLVHPNICRVHAVGEEEGVAFCVLELLEGEAVNRLVRQGPLDVKRALEITEQVARALAPRTRRDRPPRREARQRHGPRRTRATPVLIDFGLARDEDACASRRATSSRHARLHVARAGDRRPQPRRCRSDVYSLGATLYEMLTTVEPIQGDHIELDREDRDGAPAPPSERRAGIRATWTRSS